MSVLVLGAGMSGSAACRLLAHHGVPHAVYDRREDAGETLGDRSPLLSGRWDPRYLDGISLVVTSPGFKPHLTPLSDVRRAGIPIWSEVELGGRFMRRPMVAITGTNGKSTVCRQTAAMLKASGVDAVAAGNVGFPLSDVALADHAVVVLEISSFQLHYTYTLAPEVSVFLNLADDHLDWHRSMAAYRSDKDRISRGLTDEHLLVFDSDDRVATAHAAQSPGQAIPVTGVAPIRDGSFGLTSTGLLLPSGFVPMDQVPDLDPSFRVNLTAAAISSVALGGDPEASAEVVARFRHHFHRRTVVGESGGVTWVDDSKATNPHAAMAAIRSYRSVVLIAGGVRKGLDMTPLLRAPNIRHMVAMGECGPDLLDRAGGLSADYAASMEEAVRLAGTRAQPGDTVLLSPGTTGFDMFTCYEDRGNTFIRHVAEYVGEDERELGGLAR